MGPSIWKTNVYVSTDDPGIAAVARQAGAAVIDRGGRLAGPDATIAEVVDHATEQVPEVDVWLVWQPTAVHVPPGPIYSALVRGVYHATVVAETHHRIWLATEDQTFVPHSEAINRQHRAGPTALVETGVFLKSRNLPTTSPGQPIIVDESALHDIDTWSDLAAARATQAVAAIELAVVVGDKVGSGHLRRCMRLADALAPNPVFLSLVSDGFAPIPKWAEVLADQYPQVNWPLSMDLIRVSDRLESAVSDPADVILEDRSPAALASGAVVINELYETERASNEYCGTKYAVLAPEFSCFKWQQINTDAPIVVTFGGTDPSLMTERYVADLVRAGLPVTVVTPHRADVYKDPGATWVDDPFMPEIMSNSSFVITSNGRTTREAASMGVPVLSVAANRREAEHIPVPGQLHAGGWWTVQSSDLAELADTLFANHMDRQRMSWRASAAVDHRGAERVAELILATRR